MQVEHTYMIIMCINLSSTMIFSPDRNWTLITNYGSWNHKVVIDTAVIWWHETTHNILYKLDVFIKLHFKLSQFCWSRFICTNFIYVYHSNRYSVKNHMNNIIYENEKKFFFLLQTFLHFIKHILLVMAWWKLNFNTVFHFGSLLW